jgi:hypothetical protein
MCDGMDVLGLQEGCMGLGFGNTNQRAHAYGPGSHTIRTPDAFDFLERRQTTVERKRVELRKGEREQKEFNQIQWNFDVRKDKI